MATYKAIVDTWLSHECRTVKAGTVFETEFPEIKEGVPMKIGDNLELVEPKNGKTKEK